MKNSLLENFVNGGRNTLAENITVCTTTALAGTFYFYENHFGVKIHTVFCVLITAAIAAIWLICALFSGKDGKIGFVIFSFLYWSVPYVYILWYGARDNLHDYSKILSACNKTAGALLYNPFYEASEMMDTNPDILASILVILIMVAYVAGYLIKRISEAKRNDNNYLNYDEYIIDDDEG